MTLTRKKTNVDWHCCEFKKKNSDFSTYVKVGVGSGPGGPA
jgi:hypothetical protein